MKWLPDTLVFIVPSWFYRPSTQARVPFQTFSFCSSSSVLRVWQFEIKWPRRARSCPGWRGILAFSRRLRPTTGRAAAADQPRSLTEWSTSGTTRAADPDPLRTELEYILVRTIEPPSNGWKAAPLFPARNPANDWPSLRITLHTMVHLAVSSHSPTSICILTKEWLI